MMVELRPMTDQRFAIWSKKIWELYEQELIDSGIKAEAARAVSDFEDYRVYKDLAKRLTKNSI
jgi:hypothetical protein